MKGCSIDALSLSSVGSSSITSSQSEPGSYNDPRSTSSLRELEDLEDLEELKEPSKEGSGDTEVGSNWTDVCELVEERGDMTDAAEDAGEALGVREAGEGTAEALDLLLCLSEMMSACRRLVLDWESVC